MTQTIAHLVTNADHYPQHPDQPTGLWLTELTHAWQIFEEAGYQQIIISPQGGPSPLEPRAMKRPLIDSHAKDWLATHRHLLEKTQAAASVRPADLDAIYFTGGHGVMADFTEAPALQTLTAALYEQDKIVSSVCHGYCGLLKIKFSDGSYLIEGKKMTGFSWLEEKLAGVAQVVPYNAEQVARSHGASYTKAALPFAPYAVWDGNLITGQNPASAKKTARLVVQALEAKV